MGDGDEMRGKGSATYHAEATSLVKSSCRLSRREAKAAANAEAASKAAEELSAAAAAATKQKRKPKQLPMLMLPASATYHSEATSLARSSYSQSRRGPKRLPMLLPPKDTRHRDWHGPEECTTGIVTDLSQPNVIGKDARGTHDATFRPKMMTDADIHKDCYSNILLSVGTTCLLALAST